MNSKMAVERVAAEGARAASGPVFVDDTGRRRTRLRAVGRTLVVLAGLYVLLLVGGLTGSLSLPGAHLADVGRIATGAEKIALGAGSREVRIPALSSSSSVASKSSKRTTIASPAASLSGAAHGVAGRGSQPNTATGSPGLATPAVSIPGVSPTTAGPASSSPTTAGSTATSPTTVPTTTTSVNLPTRTHGHGPPTSVPGKGHKP